MGLMHTMLLCFELKLAKPAMGLINYIYNGIIFPSLNPAKFFQFNFQ